MASRPYSITPWGAKDKIDPFNSDTAGVKPGETKTYEWTVKNLVFLYQINEPKNISPCNARVGHLFNNAVAVGRHTRQEDRRQCC